MSVVMSTAVTLHTRTRSRPQVTRSHSPQRILPQRSVDSGSDSSLGLDLVSWHDGEHETRRGVGRNTEAQLERPFFPSWNDDGIMW